MGDSSNGSSRSSQPQKAAQNLVVVGIGASAGGVKALIEFFRHVKRDGEIAYVVILHLGAATREHSA